MDQGKDGENISIVRKHRLRFILILGALAAFGPLTIDMYLPAFPMLAEDLSTSPSFIQLSLTACLLGLAFGQLLFGSLSDFYGRRKPLLVALTAYMISSMLCTFAPSIGILILLRFIQGLAGAGGIVIARACVRDLYSGSEMTKMFALLMLVMGVAPILAPIIGSQLLHVVSWRGVFMTLSALGLIMLLAVMFALPDTLSPDKRSKGGLKNTLTTFKGLVTDRIFMGYALSQGLVTAMMFAYISGSPFVFQDIFQVSPQTYSLFFAVNAGGLILATQVTGRLAGTVYSESKLLRFGLGLISVASLVLLAVILLGAGLVPVAIALFVAISSVGVISTTCFSLAMQNQAQHAGRASALLGLLQFVIGGLMAPFVGIAGAHTAVPMGIVIAACGMGALASYLFMVRRANKSALSSDTGSVNL